MRGRSRGDRGKSNRRGDGDFSELSNIKGKSYKEAEKILEGYHWRDEKLKNVERA
ncbi:hypothetical protein H5U35_04035 [Candidatus Aerophobetes bacterium]|nr:hypothetical protein [Candidatus Aerophobetes bacterium]